MRSNADAPVRGVRQSFLKERLGKIVPPKLVRAERRHVDRLLLRLVDYDAGDEQ